MIDPEDILIDDCWEHCTRVCIGIDCGKHNLKEAETFKQQILSNQAIVKKLKEYLESSYAGKTYFSRDEVNSMVNKNEY